MNDYQKPYTFRAGTYAKSAEVNADFDTLKDYVNELKDYTEDILISSAPYNKANVDGNQYVNFSVATSRDGHPYDAVNRGELVTLQGEVNDIAGDVETLEATVSIAPTYNNGTTVSANTTITRNGLLVVKALSNTSEATIYIDGTAFGMAGGCIATFPVKAGTTIGSISFMNSVKLYV